MKQHAPESAAGGSEQQFESLRHKIDVSNQTISGLNESFDRIEKLITVVRGITAKTDLLALNASIEAARAGHSGKGFAVVAHEVARLAEKSQESIQNVDAVFAELKGGIQSLKVLIGQCMKDLQDLNIRNENFDQRDVA